MIDYNEASIAEVMQTISNFDFSTKNHFSLFPKKDPISVSKLDAIDFESSGDFNQPVRPSCYEFFWIKQGALCVHVDASSKVLSEGLMHCLSPAGIRYLEVDSYVDGYYISVCPQFLNLLQNRQESVDIFDFSGEIRQIAIDEELEEELDRILDKIVQEILIFSSQQSDLLRAWLNIFMLYLSRNLPPSKLDRSSTSDKELLRRFLELLPNYHSEKKMVSEYAEILCVTPNYLNSVVKKITGFPASHHIQQYLVMEAKRYAMYSQLRMKEIANRLGFADYAHFSKFFKNYAGVNFSNYLKEIKMNVA